MVPNQAYGLLIKVLHRPHRKPAVCSERVNGRGLERGFGVEVVAACRTKLVRREVAGQRVVLAAAVATLVNSLAKRAVLFSLTSNFAGGMRPKGGGIAHRVMPFRGELERAVLGLPPAQMHRGGRVGRDTARGTAE